MQGLYKFKEHVQNGNQVTINEDDCQSDDNGDTTENECSSEEGEDIETEVITDFLFESPTIL